MLKDLLESKRCFKLVCGAGNEDVLQVENLTALYAKAGCRFFDVNASSEVVEAAKRGLKFAEVDDACICVSVGIKGDPHVCKAQIDYDKCIGCGQCDEICPQRAIVYHKVKKAKCIGCGRVLPPLVKSGIDCIELHAMGENSCEIEKNWDYIKENFDGIISICTSRGKLSDKALIERIKTMTENLAPYRVIVQADGFPMSGGEDDYKTTLQAVATAEIVQNENLPVYIMLSGGTNSKTAELARMCGINYHGIAVGSYARKIVRKYIECKDFLTNKDKFNEALKIAESLVKSVEIP